MRLGSQGLVDFIVTFAKAVSSALRISPDDTTSRAVVVNIEGVSDFDPDAEGIDPSATGEAHTNQDVYGALGVVARPLPPDSGGAHPAHCEVVCLRTVDGLVPIAMRDLRLKMPGNAPHEGTVAMVGYGGGFVSMDPVNGGDDGTILVMYCPYDYTAGGVAQKAHALIMDPTSGNESVMLMHADGMSITMANESSKHEMILKNKTGTAAIILDDSGITMTGQINLAGSVVVGNPVASVPLLAGVASPPCSTLWVSP